MNQKRNSVMAVCENFQNKISRVTFFPEKVTFFPIKKTAFSPSRFNEIFLPNANKPEAVPGCVVQVSGWILQHGHLKVFSGVMHKPEMGGYRNLYVKEFPAIFIQEGF